MGNRFPSPPKRTTIEDVAALAGVSKGTVSKYLGDGDYYISAATRTRIAAAVEELDFQPNALARGLVRRRTQTIGVIVASITNPLYPELIAGAESVLGAKGYTLIFGSSENAPAKEADVVRSMRQRQVDGIIMASVTMQDDEVAQLVGSGLDVVLASRDIASNDMVDAIVVDNAAGAAAAVRHLAAHGHTRIAHIAGPQDVVPFALRCASFRDECAALELDIAPELVVEVEASTPERGAEAVEGLLDLPEPPTAVFVGSDGMALGVLEACARRGIAVPDDLAIVGFDNIWVGRLPGIRLTTIDSRAREVGMSAAAQLVDRIEARWADGGHTSSGPQTAVLPADLVTRSTCGCDGDDPPGPFLDGQ
jgi:DNA-binding LacI/PurR family transcriptional regulator